MKKGTSAVVFLPPVREKENVRPLLMLGEISKPRMDTDHWTSQPTLPMAAPLTPPLASSTANTLTSQCQAASLLQLQNNTSWFKLQRKNFKESCGQTTTLPPMRGHEGAVETQHGTVFEITEKSEHLDCWTLTAVVWDFFEQNLNPVYPLYRNTFGNDAFSLNGKEEYFQEKLTISMRKWSANVSATDLAAACNRCSTSPTRISLLASAYFK